MAEGGNHCGDQIVFASGGLRDCCQVLNIFWGCCNAPCVDIILFSLHGSLVRTVSVPLSVNEEMDVQRLADLLSAQGGSHGQSLMQLLEDRTEGYSLI